MTLMIPFPSIGQFSTVVHTVIHRATYVGKDELGKAIHDHTRPAPTLTFQGSCKLHGTNAAVARNPEGTVWCQSRPNVITVLKDNAGFAMYAESNKDAFTALFNAAESIKQRSANQSVIIFGEWCGGAIQKKIALNQLPMMFVIFAIAFAEPGNEKTWFTSVEVEATVVQAKSDLTAWPTSMYHIYQFPTWMVEIDFSKSHEIQNHLINLTVAVEQQCPVGIQLGATAEKGSLVGEGIVWRCTTPGYEDSGNWFKVKGELHSARSKVTTLNPVDIERIDAINALAEQVTPEWRLEQILQETFDMLNGGMVDIKRTGEYIKAMMTDILKEELLVIADSGFNTKELSGPVAKISRTYMLNQLPNTLKV